ncbi:hypothetical protein DICSQDRAFT_126357 [Dichomitus squalens LYAD-421 SS1]|uniref:uncharacterized protein n=1 Tax=Dichomitus squalens (strain LYAD-421) TaxID=732165 RepID=UPI0004414C4B|nr:uncharacterized protein DICSQDRAFT_126357 [Dichomitus squalens LYAD-421 SS1]EJF62639.1 hypothetical protein DICSQDRAFT_126357 [Dichomitus squalens LYAD-421 SS1]
MGLTTSSNTKTSEADFVQRAHSSYSASRSSNESDHLADALARLSISSHSGRPDTLADTFTRLSISSKRLQTSYSSESERLQSCDGDSRRRSSDELSVTSESTGSPDDSASTLVIASYRPPTTPRRRPQLPQVPKSVPAAQRSLAVASPLKTPTRQARTISAPVSPDGSPPCPSIKKTVTCSGFTKKGTKCLNPVSVSVPPGQRDQVDDEPYYCHLHKRKARVEVEFLSRESHEWVYFKGDYSLAMDIMQRTQEKIRKEMVLAPSDAEEPGYIYALKIDDSRSDAIHIKVGRTGDVGKRLATWKKECRSKRFFLLGSWPSTEDADAGKPSPYSHRLERLILLEFEDYAENGPYLHPDFPDVKGEMCSENGIARTGQACGDCKVFHREIFTFKRTKEGNEWESHFKPIIEKWEVFGRGSLYGFALSMLGRLPDREQ